MGKAVTPQHFGLTLGAVFGAIHFSWACLVAAGAAQPVLDYMFRLHMLTPAFTVAPFSAWLAFRLVLITSITGYVIGYIFGLVLKMLKNF